MPRVGKELVQGEKRFFNYGEKEEFNFRSDGYVALISEICGDVYCNVSSFGRARLVNGRLRRCQRLIVLVGLRDRIPVTTRRFCLTYMYTRSIYDECVLLEG